MKKRQRIFGLDVMRSLAIIFVLFAHSYELLLPDCKINLNRFFGFIGVEIFFVLSGFLIGNILIKIFDQEKLSFKGIKSFWIRRWFRTLPNYYLFLLIYFALHILDIIPTDLETFELFSFFFFLQNSVTPHPGFFAVAWSLSIEEWFYLLFPLATFIISKMIIRRRSILITCLLTIALCLLCRVFLSLNFDLNWSNWFRKMTFWRIDSIAVGVLAARLMIRNASFFVKHRLTLLLMSIVSLGLLLLPFWQVYVVRGQSTTFFETFFFVLVSSGISLSIPYLSTWKIQKPNYLSKCITQTSLISYSLYLSHWLVIIIIHRYFDSFSGTISFLLFYVISFGISQAIYRGFELPMTNLRDRFS